MSKQNIIQEETITLELKGPDGKIKQRIRQTRRNKNGTMVLVSTQKETLNGGSDKPC